MNNTSGFYNEKNNVKVFETLDENINMPICFVKDKDKRNQKLLVDAIPDELYYNPSSKTLFVDNIETKIANLQEGEGIQIDNSVDNKTTVNVNFDKNTATTTTLTDNDTILLQDGLDFLKTITAANLKSDLKTVAGDNLEYGTGVNSNKLSLKTAVTNTSLNSGSSWNGNFILAPKLSNGSVSDTEFQLLNGLTSAILQTSDKDQNNGVCGLDGNGFVPTSNLPASIDDIRNFADVAAFPEIGETPPPEAGIIYVALDTKKSYRWNGLASGANSVVYTEITNGLVIGTGASNAFAGNLGAANTAAIANKQNTLTASSTSGIVIDGSSNIDIDMTKSNVETEFDDNELMLIQKTNGNVCRLTKQQLKSSINTNTEYDFATPNLVTAANGTDISLNTTLTGMVKISIGTSHAGASAGLETFGKIIASRIDSNSVKDVLYLNNAGSGSGAKVGVIYRVGTNNFVTRFDGTNYLLGSSNDILDGVLTEYLRVGSSETKISGDCNLTDSHTYKINDASIDGTNLNFANNKLNLDATLTGLTSVSVRNDTSECLMLKTQNSSFLEECCITMTKNNGTSETNFGIRFDGINLKFGSSNAVVNGILTEYMRISSQELKVSGNCNLTSGHDYKINGSIIGHSYLDGTNINIDGNKNINLDTTITGLSSVTSTNFVGELNGNAATVTNGVYTTGNQSIAGVKTFTSNCVMDNDLEVGGDLSTTDISAKNNFNLDLSTTGNGNITFNTGGSERGRFYKDGGLNIGPIATRIAGVALLANGNLQTTTGLFGAVHTSGFAGLRHVSSNNSTGYCILQDTVGRTLINAETTKNIHFRLGNVDKMKLYDDRLETQQMRVDIRKDSSSSTIIREQLYLNNFVNNNAGDTGIVYRMNTSNFVTRYQKELSFALGTSNNIIGGTISPYFVIDTVASRGRSIYMYDAATTYNPFKFDLQEGTMRITGNWTSNSKILIDFFKKVGTGRSQVGRIETNGTNTFYRGDSDIRLKENIKPITNHFVILDKLNPCNFNFKSDNLPPVDGFIADEVYNTYRYAVSGKPGGMNEDGTPHYMAIDTKTFIPILTKCIKGNREEIHELKKENEELKKKNKDIVDKVYELELKLNLIYEKLNISYI